MPETVKVSEVFYSLQGEGRLAGVPSLFIRLAGCPLRCRWCDTKYAWSRSAGREFVIDELPDQLSCYPAVRHLALTGGEPMVHPNFSSLVRSLKRRGLHLTIETSGIQYLPKLPCDLMSISPKLFNSTPKEPVSAAEHEEVRFNPAVLRKLIDEYEYQLKFVVDCPEDLDEIHACLQDLGSVESNTVYLMPQAAARAEYLEKSRWLAEICLKTGFSFSPRLQVLLWDNQRGR